jgi:hypothetical protein
LILGKAHRGGRRWRRGGQVVSRAEPGVRRVEDIVRSQEDGLNRLEVEKWRWFGSSIVRERNLENLPTIFVPVFLVLFFGILLGGSFYYEGRWELSAVVLLLAFITVAVLLYVGRAKSGD